MNWQVYLPNGIRMGWMQNGSKITYWKQDRTKRPLVKPEEITKEEYYTR